MTPAMEAKLPDAPEARWGAALLALASDERAKPVGWFPHVDAVIRGLESPAVN